MSTPQPFKWRDELSVGVERLDDQHRKILAILNELHGSLGNGGAPHRRAGMLLTLQNCTLTHFAEEEHSMRRAGYPEYAFHKTVHESLKQKTAALVKQYQRIPGDLSFDDFSFLKNWWTNHILMLDQKYASFLGQQVNPQP